MLWGFSLTWRCSQGSHSGLSFICWQDWGVSLICNLFFMSITVFTTGSVWFIPVDLLLPFKSSWLVVCGYTLEKLLCKKILPCHLGHRLCLWSHIKSYMGDITSPEFISYFTISVRRCLKLLSDMHWTDDNLWTFSRRGFMWERRCPSERLWTLAECLRPVS